MEGKIEVGSIKLWLDENVIYCKITNDFNENDINEYADEILFEIISIASKGEFMPLLIDIRDVNFYTSFKLFKLLSKSSHLKDSVLSKTFLVESCVLKVILVLQSYIINPIGPDAIFSNCGSSINFCKKKYTMFNSLD